MTTLPALLKLQLKSLVPVPERVAELGIGASVAWDEFFAAAIRNPHTRAAYRRAVLRFLAWLEPQGITLPEVRAGHVGMFLDSLPLAAPTKKLELAALRAFFDVMTNRHVTVLNPALSVRGERSQVVEGLTPEITPGQARALLDSIGAASVAELRDRAVIGTLIFTAARAGAVASLTRGALTSDGTQWLLHFHEKGGKRRVIPVRHDLEQMLWDYLAAAGLTNAAAATPLFRTLVADTGRVSVRGLTGGDIGRLVKRRVRAAGLPTDLSPHSFRVCAVTNLLGQGVALEDVQYLAGHADARTTRLYDRRPRAVTRNVVERISV